MEQQFLDCRAFAAVQTTQKQLGVQWQCKRNTTKKNTNSCIMLLKLAPRGLAQNHKGATYFINSLIKLSSSHVYLD